MKKCSNCARSLDYNEFSPQKQSSDGYSSWCKPCKAEQAKVKRLAAGITPRRTTTVTKTKKECGLCNKLLPLLDFSPSKRGSGGVSSYCKCCTNLKRKTPKARAYSRAQTKAYRNRHKFRWRALHRLVQFNRKQTVRKVSTGTVTDRVLTELYQTEVCFYCGQPTPLSRRTVDHKQPLHRGGLHDQTNLVMACLHCNSSKQDKTAEEFHEFRTRIYNTST